MSVRPFLLVLLFGITIPLIGYLVSFWILGDQNQDLADAGLPSIDIICSNQELLRERDIVAACAQIDATRFLGIASVWAGFLGAATPVIIICGAMSCGFNRRRLALLFPLFVRVVLLLLSVTVLIQGAILTYTVYVAEVYTVERLHVFLVGGIGFGALFASYKLMMANAGFGRRLSVAVVGKLLADADAPNLFGYVNNLAGRLGARRPDNIVIGLEPNFFATSADVEIRGDSPKLVHGETLYISAPLTRLLSEDEFSAIIGHELGHFRGQDTLYSLKFAPVYAGLAQSIDAVSADGKGGASDLAKVPAVLALSYMYYLFSRSESAISRQREIEADQAGADASSARALATALVKLSLYAPVWSRVQGDNVERLNIGKLSRNLSAVFQAVVKYDLQSIAIQESLDDVLHTAVSHPTDTHPTLFARLQHLEIDPADLSKDDLLVPPYSAARLLDGVREIEEDLSVTEHRRLVALGHAEVPEDKDCNDNNDILRRLLCCLAAAVIRADGNCRAEEVYVAEAIGAQLIDGFDAVELREMCDEYYDIPDCAVVADLVRSLVDDGGNTAVLEYLQTIAEADGSVDSEEERVLGRIKEALRGNN